MDRRQILCSLGLALASASASLAQVTQPTGFILGVTSVQTAGGLRVLSTTPGTPASGLFFPDDVLTRASDLRQVLSIHTHANLEAVKQLAGPRWFVIEAWRPSLGQYVHRWVQLRPVGPIQQNYQQVNARPNGRASDAFSRVLKQGRK